VIPVRRAGLATFALALVAAGPSSDPAPLGWHKAGPGLEWAERPLDRGESSWPARVVVVRVDPARYAFRLVAAISPGGTTAEWTVGRAPPSVVLALNAGQFVGAAPWGWVVHEGIEARPPGRGPLASAIVFGRDRRVRIADAGELDAVRDSGVATEAFQSYPTLLHGDGEIPDALVHDGRGIDRTHPDTRLALGLLADGRLLVVLTRFGGLGDAAASAPLGPTVPQMAALMRRLRCRRAVSLDGGLSSQLLLRDSTGVTHTWRGWRPVPLGLVATIPDASSSR
jgi:exopolysaccharide biosynthesis protein